MQHPNSRTDLPTEIWHNCWSNLPMAELIVLSMTCWLFHDICRPQMFKRLGYLDFAQAVDEPILDEDYEKWKRRAVRFEGKLKWLASDPIRARYPRECDFWGISREDAYYFNLQRPELGKAYQSLLSTFKTSLASFLNLRHLELADFEVDEEFVREISKIPFLKCIRLDGGIDFSCLSHSPLIHVTELHISEWSEGQLTDINMPFVKPLQLFSNQDLETIDIESFRYTLPCLQHFVSQGTSKALTTLQILLDINIIPALFAFLETCPNLKTFVATTGKSPPLNFNPTFPSLSSSALPNLGYYKGVASLAAVLVPGRPVQNIILSDSWSGSSDNVRHSSTLHELTKSSVMVKHLVLPFMETRNNIFCDFVKQFPNLETLQLNFIISDVDKLHFPDDDAVPDEQYFDTIPETEFSSIPVDENGCPTIPPTTLRGIMYWLCLNKLPIPSTVRGLSIHISDYFHGVKRFIKTFLSFREQHHVLRMLTEHFPGLQSMTFGVPRIRWVRNDDGEWDPDEGYKSFLENRQEWLET